MSSGAYNAATWSNIDSTSLRKFHAAVIHTYRHATDSKYNPFSSDSFINDNDLIHEYSLISPMTIIRSARLSLFGRIAHKQPTHITTLLQHALDEETPFGWAAEIKSDMFWLAQSGHTKPPYTQLNACFNYAAASPRSFLSGVRRYSLSPFANFDVVFMHHSLQPCLGDNMVCDICDKSFPSIQKCNLHKFNVHGIKDPIRLYIDHTQHHDCLVCMKRFHTRERLCKHIRYRSSVCKYNVILRGAALSNSEADDIDRSYQEANRTLLRAGNRRHTMIEPVVRIPGPLLPIILEPSTKESTHHPLGFGHQYYV